MVGRFNAASEFEPSSGARFFGQRTLSMPAYRAFEQLAAHRNEC